MRLHAPAALALVLGLALVPASVHAAPRGAAAFAPRFAPVESMYVHGRFRDASRFLDSALADARAHGPAPLLVESLVRHGGALAYAGRGDGGLAELREAATRARAQRDTFAECRATQWLGVGLTNLGRHRESRPVYERQRVLARAIGDHALEGGALIGLAYVDLTEGRAALARDRYRRAQERLVRATSGRLPCTALVGEGRACDALGDVEGARRCWTRAAERANAEGLTAIESDALNNLAGLEYQMGDPAEAVRLWQLALARDRSSGREFDWSAPRANLTRAMAELARFDEAGALLDSMALRARTPDAVVGITALRSEVLLAGQRPLEAVRTCRALLANERELQPIHVVRLRMRLAEALRGAHRDAEALAQCDTLATLPASAGGVGDRADAARLRGEALLALGRPAEALRTFALAKRLARDAGLRQSELMTLRQSARASLALGHRREQRATLEEAAGTWERWRGVSRDAGWRESRGTWAARLDGALAAAMLASASAGAPPATAAAPAPISARRSPAAIRAAFDAQQRFKARTLEERARGPGAAPIASARVTAAALQRDVLRDGELLLDVVAGVDTSFVFALTRREARVWGLPGDPLLAERVAPYLALVAKRPGPGDPDAALRSHASEALAELLLGPGRTLVASASRVIVAPDGALGRVPFAALAPVRAGGAASAWTQVPSATVFARLRGAHRVRSAPRALLALGTGRDAEGRALAGTVRELDELAGGFAGADRRPSREARTASAIASTLARYDVIHVAAHGEVRGGRPWSAKVLVGDDARDRWLDAATVARLRLGARLAVLSSCASLGAEPVPVEGLQGMGSAFLCAGVPTVIGTLWPVDDEGTARLVRAFYRSLASGRDAASALRAAQDEVRRDPATSHPYYWAGFVLVGEPDTRIELRRATSRPSWP